MISFLPPLSPVHFGLMAGFFSFLLLIFPPFLPFLSFLCSFFSAVPLYMVGILYGPWLAGLSSIVTGTLLLLTVSPLSIVFYAFSTTFPLIILISVLRNKKNIPLGRGISAVALYGLMVLTVTTVIFFGMPGRDPMVFFNQKLSGLPLAGFMETYPLIASCIPGFMAVSVILSALCNVLPSLNYLENQGRIPRTGREWTPPSFWDIGLCLGFLLLFWNSPTRFFLGINVIFISCIPLFTSGLTVIWDLFRRYGIKKQFFYAFLGICVFFLVWIGPFVVLIGFLEPFLAIRKKLNS